MRVNEIGDDPAEVPPAETTSSRRRRTEVIVSRDTGEDDEVYEGKAAEQIVGFIADTGLTASSRRRRES